MSPRNKISGYFDEIDKYRGHDMQSRVDPETAAWQWFSPAYHTTAVKWTSPVTSQLFLEAGWSSNLEYYTNSYQDGVEEPRGTAGWFAKASRNELDLGGINVAPTSRLTESPARYAVSEPATYVTGPHNLKAGMQMTWGTFYHTHATPMRISSSSTAARRRASPSPCRTAWSSATRRSSTASA